MKTIRLFVFLMFTLGIETGFAQIFSERYNTRKALFEEEPDKINEIIFLGNSITEGGDWKALFTSVNAINRGISGDVTDSILYRLDEVVSSKPIKIFLLIGVNDLAHRKSPQYVLDNIKKIVSKIKTTTPETQIYLQSVLPVSPKVGHKFASHKSKQQQIIQVNRGLAQLSETEGVLFIYLHKKFENLKGELIRKYTYDGLHLSAKGYKKWRKEIIKYIQ